MKYKGKIHLSLLSLLACLLLSACQPAAPKESAQSVAIKSFVGALRDAKSMEYVSKIYRKNLTSLGEARRYRGETLIRDGKIQFEPLKYSEYQENSARTDIEDREEIDKVLNTVGPADFMYLPLKVYSPEEGVQYRSSYTPYREGKEPERVWKKAKQESDEKNKERDKMDPEVGRHELILKLYEKYAEEFSRNEDGNYVYLDYQGDITEDKDQAGEMQSTLLNSSIFTKYKDEITGVNLEMHLVLRKETSEKKEILVPNEARIELKTQVESKDGLKTSNEDYFEFIYRDINKVDEIKAPSDLDISKIKDQ